MSSSRTPVLYSEIFSVSVNINRLKISTYVKLKFGHFFSKKIGIVDFWTNDFIFGVTVMILYIGVCNFIDVLVRA